MSIRISDMTMLGNGGVENAANLARDIQRAVTSIATQCQCAVDAFAGYANKSSAGHGFKPGHSR